MAAEESAAEQLTEPVVKGRNFESPISSVAGEKEKDENASQASWSNWNTSWWRSMSNEDASWAQQSWEEASRWRRTGDAGPPPSFSGSLEVGKLESYYLRAILWLQTTKLEGSSRGARLLQALEGSAWEGCKHLVKDEEFMKAEDNGERLLKLLQSEGMFGLPHTQKLLYDFKNALYLVQRKRGERSQEFMPRWREAKAAVEAHGVKLPSPLLGFLLVMSYVLSAADRQKLMIHTQGQINETNIVTGLRQMEAALDLGSRDAGTARQRLYHNDLVDPGPVSGVGSSDEEWKSFAKEDGESICLTMALEELSDVEAEDGAIAESECRDILHAFVKKRKRTFADAVKGKTWKKNTRCFSGSVYKSAEDGQYAKDTRQSIKKLKQNTLRGFCRQKGHWHRDCPKKHPHKASEKKIDMMTMICEPPEKRQDPILGNASMTYEQMCSVYWLRGEGLTEAQMKDHWKNLKVATYVDDAVMATPFPTDVPFPTDSNDAFGDVAPCPAASVASRSEHEEPEAEYLVNSLMMMLEKVIKLPAGSDMDQLVGGTAPPCENG